MVFVAYGLSERGLAELFTSIEHSGLDAAFVLGSP